MYFIVDKISIQLIGEPIDWVVSM